MRILITGGAGFIGSHLAEHYQNRAEVVILDNFRTGLKGNIDESKCTLIEGSVNDPAAVNQAMQGVDLVFHLAAMTSVAESMQNPSECVAINVSGLITVLEAAAANQVGKFIFASSASVYGDNHEVPHHETTKPEPKSPYAITKLDGEFYLEIFRNSGRLKTASMRFFNVFGSRQRPDDAYAAAISIFLSQSLANDDITIYGDGLQTRDFVHVEDVVSALAHVAEHPDTSGTYNVGYGSSITINELAAKIIQLTGSHSKIIHAAERPGDVRHSVASVEKLLNTGFIHSSSLENGLSQLITDLHPC